MSKQILDSVFSSLSDATRRDILDRVSNDDLTVSEIARPYKSRMSLPAISKHLDVLEKARLIQRKKEGREIWIHLTPKPLEEALAYIAFYKKFWHTKLDDLEIYLARTTKKKGGKNGR